MTKRKSDVRTLDLFSIPKPVHPAEATLNFTVEIRHLLSRLLKESHFDRYEVASRMSRFLGVTVSKEQLDAWTAESRKQWRFPVEYITAFEAAVETHGLLEFLIAKRGGIALWGEDALKAELGRLEVKEARVKKERKAIKQKIESFADEQ